MDTSVVNDMTTAEDSQQVQVQDFPDLVYDNVSDSAPPSDLPIRHLILDGVQLEESEFVGKGAFGSVHQAMYGGTACALKVQTFGGRVVGKPEVFCVYSVEDFQRECLLHYKLHHPNVVKMYGVYHHSETPGQPIKVMELVEGGTLSSFLNLVIPLYVKLSILQDVSRGVYYLHSHSPPIIHSHINTDIILLTSTLTAKIGSFTFAQEVSQEALVPKAGKVVNSKQLPVHIYQPLLSVTHGFPFDVYLFGSLICRVMTQVRCGKLYQYMADLNTNRLSVVSDFTHLQKYVNHLSHCPLKELALQCLDDPVERPSMLYVCERIDAMLKGKLWHIVFHKLAVIIA